MITKSNEHLSLKEQERLLTRLSQLLSQGYSFMQALDVMFVSCQGKERDMMKRLEYLISTGTPLMEAFQKASFSTDVVLIIAQAETHGNLAEALRKASEWKRRQIRFKAELRKALTYPFILFVVILLISYLLFQVVIPQFSYLFEVYDIEVPVSTTVILYLVSILEQYYIPMVLTLFLMLAAVLFGWKKGVLQDRVAQVVARCRWINRWTRTFFTIMFCTQLGYLLQANVPLFHALQQVLHTAGSVHFKKTLERIEQELMQGKCLSEALKQDDVFVPELSAVVYHAEKNGQLAQHLVTYGQYLESEVLDRSLERLKWIEPVLLLMVGLVTSYLFFALFRPVFQLIEAL
ncbi:type II secretion system protein F [Caldalkalibacillus thermarum]|uniref:type II secretion system F family protein n=1 Tax=Caldalkalibacillus thermarum TaxID=296745 RepID=UPI00166442DA|nr:type II secretion system F family protein [Caldalkalibacillus thermarum]GGK19312.1 type II secretion system protein F [Caldalkalibacillus thermarum]